SVTMVRDWRRSEKAGELEPAVAVRRAHHGDLDALVAESSDTSGPFTFDRGQPFELEAELAKEINRRLEVIDHDSYVVHPLERHVSNLQPQRQLRGQDRASSGTGVGIHTMPAFESETVMILMVGAQGLEPRTSCV